MPLTVSAVGHDAADLADRGRVTVSGRPVAELRPLPTRPTSMAWDAFFRDSDRWRADPGLAEELAELLPDTTDDLPIQ